MLVSYPCRAHHTDLVPAVQSSHDDASVQYLLTIANIDTVWENAMQEEDTA